MSVAYRADYAMPDNKDPLKPDQQLGTDWWSQRFGNKGLLQLLIGTDAASFVLALLGVAFFWVITVQQDHGPLGSLIWIFGLLIVLQSLGKVVTQIIRLVEAMRRR
jgi:hypothetical protein